MLISELITEKYESLSKTHKVIAKYVLEHTTETSYLSIKELSERTGAGEATIMRFCTKLGFDGYPDFKTALRDDLADRGNIALRLKESYKVYEGRGEAVMKMFQDDMDRIQRTLDQMDVDEFFRVCDELILAKRIFIITGRSSSSLGMFFQYYLNMTLGNVQLITDMGCNADQLVDLNGNDVVVGISFARYTKSTVELFRFAKEKGAKTITITDSPVSPMKKYADLCLLSEAFLPSYIDSFVAPMALLNAILTEIGRNRNVQLEKRLSELDAFYKEYNIF